MCGKLHDVLKATSGEIDLIKCFATVMFACSSSVVRSGEVSEEAPKFVKRPNPKVPNTSIHEQDINFHMDVKITIKRISMRYFVLTMTVHIEDLSSGL